MKKKRRPANMVDCNRNWIGYLDKDLSVGGDLLRWMGWTEEDGSEGMMEK